MLPHIYLEDKVRLAHDMATDEVEMYVSQVTTEFRSTDIAQLDWANTLDSAPVAIGILGECLIASSLRRTALVMLEDDRLKCVNPIQSLPSPK